MKKILTILLVLSVLLGVSSTALASSTDAPGEATSTAVLNADAIRYDVTVPTSVLIYVTSAGEVIAPDYVPIINNSVAPVSASSIQVTAEGGWTLDPIITDYSKFKVGHKSFKMALDGRDTAYGVISLDTPIYGLSSLDLNLSADVAPQKEVITATQIGEMIITVGWYTDEDTGGGDKIPAGYVIPDDSEWYGEVDGEFLYIGSSEYVAIPNVIKNIPVTSYRSMFALTNVKGVYSNNPNITDTSEMFMSSQAESLDININTKNIVNTDGMFLFASAVTGSVYSQTDADIFNSSAGKPDDLIFIVVAGGDKDPESPDTGEYPAGYVLATDEDFSGEADGEFKYIGTADYVVIPDKIKGIPVTSYYDMFSGTAIKGVASTNPNITDMQRMFCLSSSSTLDLSNFNTANVTNFDGMFMYAAATTLDLSSFNTSNATSMWSMFSNSAATTLDLSSFDTTNVTNMTQMFGDCAATTLDLSNFDTTNVTDMGYMFMNASTTTGYARTQEDANKFNATESLPEGLFFTIK